MKQEQTLEVPKRTVDVMIRHFEILIRDFERLAELDTVKKIDKRIEDIKQGKITGYHESEYVKFMKKKGINGYRI